MLGALGAQNAVYKAQLAAQIGQSHSGKIAHHGAARGCGSASEAQLGHDFLRVCRHESHALGHTCGGQHALCEREGGGIEVGGHDGAGAAPRGLGTGIGLVDERGPSGLVVRGPAFKAPAGSQQAGGAVEQLLGRLQHDAAARAVRVYQHERAGSGGARLNGGRGRIWLDGSSRTSSGGVLCVRAHFRESNV